MPACFLRLASWAHTSGRYRRKAMGRLAMLLVTDRLTATRQLSRLPTCPQYCRVTLTEWMPFFGNPVSSTIHASSPPCPSWQPHHNCAPAPGLPHHSRAHPRPNDEATDAYGGYCPEQAEPPWVRHSCAHREAKVPYSRLSTVRFDPRALRPSPGLHICRKALC